MENRKKIDDLFKDELGNYTEAPPPAVWDALEKKLPSGRSRRPIGWFGYSALLLVLVAITILVARNMSGNTDAVKDIAANTTTPQAEQTGNNIGNTATGNIKAPAINDQQNEAGQQPAPTDKRMNGSAENKKEQLTDKQLITKNIESKTKSNKTTDDKPTNHSSKPYVKFASMPTNAQMNSNGQLPKNEYSDAAGTRTVAVTNAIGKDQNSDIQQPQNVYNSSPSNSETATDNTTANNDKVKEPTKPENPPATQEKKTQSKPKYKHFEAGIKGGYEFGMDNDAAKKAVLSPYLQYKITKKFAIMLQPAIKSASLGSKSIGNPKTYYKVNKDGNVTAKTDSIPIVVSPTEVYWSWRYSYKETHDSIVKTNKTGGTYVELELPVLLKYYITNDFSVYGGVNMAYSNVMGITEQTYTSRSLARSTSATTWAPINTPAPPPPATLNTEINYKGANYTTYTGPEYPVPSGSLLRFGYMFGFSYEYNKKWLFDGLVQQGMVQPNVQGGYNTNAPLSAPYIRLTIGYKLTK